MERQNQYGFSHNSACMHDLAGREKKACTMVAVLADFLGSRRLKNSSIINVGGSAGIIDNYLADHCARVLSLDIDAPAVEYAKSHFQKANLTFVVGDALDIQAADQSFDIAISSQVYEHVPDAEKMMSELYRILKPGGICYFAATNRLMWNEPHYNLKLLSVMPRWLAHSYIRMTGKASFYHEKHFTYWGLKRLVREFTIHDYTRRIIEDPERFSFTYMLKPGSSKAVIASLIARNLIWLCPGYIWLLHKPPSDRQPA